MLILPILHSDDFKGIFLILSPPRLYLFSIVIYNNYDHQWRIYTICMNT